MSSIIINKILADVEVKIGTCESRSIHSGCSVGELSMFSSLSGQCVYSSCRLALSTSARTKFGQDYMVIIWLKIIFTKNW